MNLWKKFLLTEEKFPNKIALKFKDETLTYKELKNEVEKFSSFLFQKKEKLVLLYYKKSFEYIISFLSCFRTGKIFVPIDELIPISRVNQIASRLENCIKLSNFYQEESFTFHHKNFSFEKIKFKEKNKNLAYILFTSGSTGEPKGVLVSNRGILNFLNSQIAFFEVNENSTVLQNLSIGFDASISEIGISLLSGAKLIIPDSIDYKKILKQENVTHLCISPSVLATENPENFSDSIQKLILGGEISKKEVREKFLKKFDLINVYGPTEATVCTSFEKMSIDISKNLIGKPIQNMEYKVLDENFLEVTEGELFIAGLGLAIGYFKNRALTKSKFIQLNGKKFYRTGDKVKKGNSNFEFIGRIDRQFKFNGKLIEPYEIENFLDKSLSIEYLNLKKEIWNHREYLVLYYFAKENLNLKILDLIETNFPIWMIPNKLIRLDSLNWNENQKLVLKKNHSIEEFIKEILQIEEIDFEKNFFELGGDSLKFLEFLSFLSNFSLIDPANFSMNQKLNSIFSEKNLNSYDTVDLISRIKSIPIQNFSKQKSFIKKIFITGSTGFLGKYILENLLKQDFEITALTRQKKIFSGNNKKLNYIFGDLSLENFGIKNSIWKNLKPDLILNIAANLNLSRNFFELEAENSNSIYSILKLANHNDSEIHHISTLSVLLNSDLKEKTLFEKNISEFQISKLYGGYASSKFLAEKILEKSNLNYFIYRLGLLTDSLDKNIFSENFFNLFLLKIFKLKKAPSLNLKYEMNLSPVDFIASEITSNLNTKKRIIHLANLPNLSFQFFLKTLNEFDSRIKIVSEQEFNSSNLETKIYHANQELQNLNLFLATDFQFQVSNKENFDLRKILFHYFKLAKAKTQ